MMGTRGIRKKELQPEAKLAQKIESVQSRGQKMNMALIEPNMHTTIHFLNCPLFRCIGPSMTTPMMPVTMGNPPTAPTAIGKSSPPNQGYMRKDNTTDIPLKMPKQHPKAKSMKIQSLFENSLRMAVLKGYLGAPTEAEGGVGGLDSWNKMLSRQMQYPKTASTSIVLKARDLPQSLLLRSGLQSPKTMAGTKMPSTRETLRIRVSSCVTPARVSAVNQFEDIFVWQLRMKGRPIPATTCPAIAHQKFSLMSNLIDIPTIHSTEPIAIPTRVPQVSMQQAAGKVKMGCINTNSNPPRFTTTGDSSQIQERQAAIGVNVLTRMAVIICASANWATTKKRFGYTLYSPCSDSMKQVIIYNRQLLVIITNNNHTQTLNTLFIDIQKALIRPTYYQIKKMKEINLFISSQLMITHSQFQQHKFILIRRMYAVIIRVILIVCRYSHMSAHHNAIQKARKILNAYEDIEPRKYCVQPHTSSASKSQQRSVSASRSTSNHKKDFSFCRSGIKPASPSSSKRQPSNSSASFTSLYARQTRYDKIMKLKVKPAFRETRRDDRTKKSVLDSSRSSAASEDKENRVRNKSRLDRIMNIKIAKPRVASTLIHYQPKQGARAPPQQRKQSAVKQWKESQQKVKRSKQQEEREDRLWRVFEREREIRFKLKKNAQEREQKQKRRRQQRFQSMVGKEVQKIEREREVTKRKSEGFTNYIYPFF